MSKSLTAYKSIERSLTLLNYELSNNVKLGVVTGENSLNNVLVHRDTVKTFITEAGEKWRFN